MLKLARIFRDGMILQRRRPVSIWGCEDQCDRVAVRLQGTEYSAAVSDGKFLVELPSREAVENITIEIEGSEKIVLQNVCFGDVFFLTGQSNMELPVYRTMDVSEEEIKNSNYPFIRQYRVTPQYRLSEEKEAELPDLPWTEATGEDLLQMSAAGFYCAKRIYEKEHIPIGLVLGAQGGSTIESWMPTDLLSKFGNYEEKFQPFLEDGALQKYLEENALRNAAWRDALICDDEEIQRSQIPEDAEDFTVPGMILESLGNAYCGVLWFYKEFELKEEPSEDAFVYVGNLIDSDVTYINGVEVGTIGYRYPPRKYPFDGKILKKGRNLLSVRLILENGNGGLVDAHPYFIRSGNEKIDLTGTWKMAKGTYCSSPFVPGYLGQEIPTGLYKATVRPLRNFAFRGIWWYQGESNSDQPARYGEKLSGMIDAWRKLFKQDLPLLCIEMPNYTDPILGKQPEGWAEIQRQQREAEKNIPDCKVVSARDLFTPWELHPQRKSELGARMAEAAMQVYY
ncbi:MAG: hypothetical protein J6Y08_04770 [Clostridiales bacterium]|nr:hypothetical protein [Clostridiales bacterium]